LDFAFNDLLEGKPDFLSSVNFMLKLVQNAVVDVVVVVVVVSK
jgi:hypothetical protein